MKTFIKNALIFIECLPCALADTARYAMRIPFWKWF